MASSFIDPVLEQDKFIIDVLTKLQIYKPIPGIEYVSENSQLKDCSYYISINDCREYHTQITEHWKYLDKYLVSVETNQYISCLKMFWHKPIVPASNNTLVPICNAKMVLSPQDYGLQSTMKRLGFAALDFSMLSHEEMFPIYTNALREVLADGHNRDDILNCIILNDLSPVLPSDCDLKSDLRHFFYVISKSPVLYKAKNSLFKLPIFETITAEL